MRASGPSPYRALVQGQRQTRDSTACPAAMRLRWQPRRCSARNQPATARSSQKHPACANDPPPEGRSNNSSITQPKRSPAIKSASRYSRAGPGPKVAAAGFFTRDICRYRRRRSKQQRHGNGHSHSPLTPQDWRQQHRLRHERHRVDGVKACAPRETLTGRAYGRCAIQVKVQAVDARDGRKRDQTRHCTHSERKPGAPSKSPHGSQRAKPWLRASAAGVAGHARAWPVSRACCD